MAKKPETLIEITPAEGHDSTKKHRTTAREIVEPQLTEGKDFKQIAAWYKKNADRVTHIRCTNPDHDAIIAIEAIVPGYINKQHPTGAQIVPINDQLLSYRVRLDNSIGFLCQCGVDTLLLPEEAGLRGMAGVPPHVAEEIKARIKSGRQVQNPKAEKLQAKHFKEFKREKVK